MISSVKNFYNEWFNKINKNLCISEEVKIIYLYRYFSWVLTSCVYLITWPYSVTFFKLGVILSLLFLSFVSSSFYIKYRENKNTLRSLVLIETIGIAFLLLPTGGMKSPFIWYALNPTLVAAFYLPPIFCWINLIFYLCTGSIMTYILFNPQNISLFRVIIDNSNIALAFILIYLAVQLLSNLINKLQQSNFEKQESIEQMMSLYQIIEALNNHSSKDKLFDTLAIYTKKITKSKMSIYYLKTLNSDKDVVKCSTYLNELEQEQILLEFKKVEFDLSEHKEVLEVKIFNKEFLAIPIMSASSNFGTIAIQKRDYYATDDKFQDIRLLEFLSRLSAVILERFNLEDIEDYLLVMEEQNRIANEIHDSVSQRLFSISYGIHGLIGRWNNLSKDEIKDYMLEMKNSSNMAMQELRNSIYKLSSKKKGEKYLQVTIQKLLDSISKLNSITIEFNIEGDESLLSTQMKKGITRIIHEACGNAIRHGKCLHIYLNLIIKVDTINLCITDDGCGFIINKKESENNGGLGLSNMKNLVNSFNGKIEINSQVGRGTEINIKIPVNEFSKEYEGGVAI